MSMLMNSMSDNGDVEFEVSTYTGEGYEDSYHDLSFEELERIYFLALQQRESTRS